METHERLKFLRSLTPYTQHDMADKLGIAQSNVGHMETGRIGLRKAYESDVGNILGVNPDWLQNGPEFPITDGALIFFELPATDPSKPELILAKRKIFETADSLKKFLGAFLDENGGEKDFFVEELSDEEKLYIFPLYHKKIMLLKVSEYMTLIKVIEEVLAKNDFIRHSGRDITRSKFEALSKNNINSVQKFLEDHDYTSSQTFPKAVGEPSEKVKKQERKTVEDVSSVDKQLLDYMKILIQKMEKMETEMAAQREEMEKIRMQMAKEK